MIEGKKGFFSEGGCTATCTDNTNYEGMLCWKRKQVFTFIYLFTYFLAKGPKQTLHVSRYMDVPLKMNSTNSS